MAPSEGELIDHYVVCRTVIGSPSTVAADEQEYKACRAALDGLKHICDVEEKFESIIENYVEWETVISHHTLREMLSWTFDDIEAHGSRKLIARKLLNLLAFTRLYVDSLPKHAKSILSDDEVALKQVTDAPRVQYDSRLSYRMMEALRNYAQHSALPIHGLEIHSSWDVETEPHTHNFAIWPRLDSEQLAEDGHFKASVLKELANLEKIELKPMVREYVECICAIHNTFRTVSKSRANDWIAQLDQPTERYRREFPNEGTIGLAVLPVDHRGLRMNEPVYIAGPIKKYLAHMQSNYTTMNNFAKRRVQF